MSRNNVQHDAKIKVLITIIIACFNTFLIRNQCFAEYYPVIFLI